MGSKNHDQRTRRTVLQTIGASGLALFVAASSAAADDGSETGTSTEGDDADPDEGWAWEATKADTPDPDEGWAWDAGDDSQDPDEGWAWDPEN